MIFFAGWPGFSRAAKLKEALESAVRALSAERQKAAAPADRLTDIEEQLEGAHAALLAEPQRPAEQANRLADLERDLGIAEPNHAAATEELWQLGSERSALWRRISDLSDEQRRQQADSEDAVAKLKQELASAHSALSTEPQMVAEQADRLADLEEDRRTAEASLAAAPRKSSNSGPSSLSQARTAAKQLGTIGSA
jgi:predicted  nucleic acid-binding Zn-ribbon protein